MKKRSDQESFESLEASLSALYRAASPDPAFTEKLERRLLALEPVEEEIPAWRRKLEEFFSISARSLAWATMAVLLVAGLIWSINHLLPASLPAALQNSSSASPSPTLDVVETLPVSAQLETADLLSLSSSHQEIRERLTRPQWSSLWAQGWAVRPQAGGESEKSFVQAWLEEGGSGRVISSGWLSGDAEFSLDLAPESAWAISNPRGQLWTLDVPSGRTSGSASSGDWVLHPLEEVSPVLEMIFLPRQLVLLSSDVNPIDEETYAGRPVLVVEWGGNRLWADAETGLVLRRRSLEGVSPEMEVGLDQIVYGVKVPEVLFSPDGLEGAHFVPAPSGEVEEHLPDPAAAENEPRITVREDIEAVNLRSGPGVETFPVIGTLRAGESAIALGRSPDGEWIQVRVSELTEGIAWIYAEYVILEGAEELPVVNPPVPELTPTSTPVPVVNQEGAPVRVTLGGGPLPGVSNSGNLFFALQVWEDGYLDRLFGVDLPCLLTDTTCRAVPIPDFQSESGASIDGLFWARDGKKAVVVDGRSHQLHLYRAGPGEWQTIASQLFISSGALAWSPDGTYLAGTTQGEDGLSNLVTVIPADGEKEEPSWRVFAEDLGGDQVVIGWIDDQNLLFLRYWAPPKGASGEPEPMRIYRLNIISGEWSELPFTPGANKNFPALSPDGRTLILSMERDGLMGLWSADLGSGEVEFLGVNGDNPTWSPDGRQIAFSTYENGRYNAYVIDRDGDGLKKLFEWNSPFSITWSPDGSRLLLQIWANADTGTLLYLVSVQDGLAQRLLLEGGLAELEPRHPTFQPGN